MKSVINKYAYHFLLLGIWLVLIILVNPYGEFPINDDWAYTHNLRGLVDEHRFKFSFWPAMTLVTQTVWGAIFCKLFGFSFFILRVATLVLAFGTTSLFFEVIRRETRQKFWAFALSTVLIASPLVLTQSFTFMTEIYFLFFGLCAILFYRAHFRNGGLIFWVFGIAFSVMTIYVRQTGLIIPIAFMFAHLLFQRFTVINILLALIPPVIGYYSIEWYVQWRTGLGEIMGSFSELNTLLETAKDHKLSYYVQRLGTLLHTAGFILAPLSIALIVGKKKALSLTGKLVFLVFTGLIVHVMIESWDPFPTGNLFLNFEIGPKLVKGSEFMDRSGMGISFVVWWVFRVLNVLSILTFVYGVFSWIFAKKTEEVGKPFMAFLKKNPLLVMLIFLAGGQLMYLMMNPIYFDRYCVSLGFTMLLIIGLTMSHVHLRLKRIVLGISTAFMLISGLLVKDFMNWHRVKWEAIDYARFTMGIERSHIDGGFEYCALHLFGPVLNPSPDRNAKSWWFVDRDDYIVTSEEFENYEKIKGFDLKQLISSGRDSIFIQKRIEEIPE